MEPQTTRSIGARTGETSRKRGNITIEKRKKIEKLAWILGKKNVERCTTECLLNYIKKHKDD